MELLSTDHILKSQVRRTWKDNIESVNVFSSSVNWDYKEAQKILS